MLPFIHQLTGMWPDRYGNRAPAPFFPPYVPGKPMWDKGSWGFALGIHLASSSLHPWWLQVSPAR